MSCCSVRPSRGDGAHDAAGRSRCWRPRSPAALSSSARASSSRAAASGADVEQHGGGARAIERAPAGPAHRRWRHRRGRCRRTRARRRGARARHRGRRRGARPRPWPRGRRSGSRRRASVASPASSTSVRRSSRDWSNRMVGCGSQARRAPGAEVELDADLGVAVARAIDLLGRGRGDGRPRRRRASVTSTSMRSPPVSPPAVLSSTASGGAPSPGLGKRTRAAPAWCRTPSAVSLVPAREAEPDRAFRARQPGPRLQHPSGSLRL